MYNKFNVYILFLFYADMYEKKKQTFFTVNDKTLLQKINEI